MNTLKEIAIEALRQGSDYFGETITGETSKLNYNTPMDIDLNTGRVASPYYDMTVFLLEANNRKSTAGIGFYPTGFKQLKVVSGHEVFTINITSEIQAELDNASRH